MSERIGVVGAGILGLAVARRLLQVDPDSQVTVLEKEAGPARHQTGRNSGVAHAGIYYPTGSLKAGLCRAGIAMLEEFCAEHELPYRACGKLVVARHRGEVARLEEIERRARANGVPGIRRLQGPELAEVEPHVRGLAAVHSPTTAIVDFAAIAAALGREIERVGGSLRFGFAVAGIRRRRGETRLLTASGDEAAFTRVVVCAGLQSDRLARMAGDGPDPKIVPFRGEYLRLRRDRTDLVRGLIYPVPDPAYPFLGVHFTRRVGGDVDIGPNAVLALAREGYRRRDISPRDLAETFRYPGFRRLLRRHWRMALHELRGSLWRRAFVAEARSFLPELALDDVEPAPAGVRAQALDRDGSLVDDFRITGRDGLVIVRNAPSPGATSSLAIAEHIVREMGC